MLSNSGARLLVIEAEIVSALDELDFPDLALETIWVIGDAARPGAVPPAIAFATLPAPASEIPAAAVAPDEPFTILYTSGTTGLSKGVVCPHAQFFWWGVYTGRALGIRQGDVLHTPLPRFHTNALNCFCQACCTAGRRSRRFDISRKATDHVAFGHRIHACMAMHLARMEITALLQAMIERVDRISVGKPVRARNNALNGYASIPVTFH